LTKFLLIALTLIQSPTFGEDKMFTPDQAYSSGKYQEFGLFEFKFRTDYDTQKEFLYLEGMIWESTMSPNHQSDSRPTVKEFYDRLEIYFDGNRKKPDITVRVSPSSLGPPDVTPMLDGRIVDSIAVRMEPNDVRKFKSRKPDKVTVVFLDRQGKIVSSNEIDPPDFSMARK
jgi:hypothetical protein